MTGKTFTLATVWNLAGPSMVEDLSYIAFKSSKVKSLMSKSFVDFQLAQSTDAVKLPGVNAGRWGGWVAMAGVGFVEEIRHQDTFGRAYVQERFPVDVEADWLLQIFKEMHTDNICFVRETGWWRRISER